MGVRFPRFMSLAPRTIIRLVTGKMALPSCPRTRISITASTSGTSLGMQFIPMICHGKVCRHVGSFGLSIVDAPVSTAALTTAETTALTAARGSILSSKQFIGVHISSAKICHVARTRLEGVKFSGPSGIQVCNCKKCLLSRGFSRRPTSSLPRIPLCHKNSKILFCTHNALR